MVSRNKIKLHIVGVRLSGDQKRRAEAAVAILSRQRGEVVHLGAVVRDAAMTRFDEIIAEAGRKADRGEEEEDEEAAPARRAAA